ncbi:hypothetical protein Fmac_011281 [Flemingia macrophylla]|uniref:Protein kinase domain-containing protein n=1 Tax=Flemingia macrophylla TaxID=520843 RepID=A0ABD1MM14_9FABA
MKTKSTPKDSKIATATNNFHLSNKLGKGGYGPVYKVVFFNREMALDESEEEVISPKLVIQKGKEPMSTVAPEVPGISSFTLWRFSIIFLLRFRRVSFWRRSWRIYKHRDLIKNMAVTLVRQDPCIRIQDGISLAISKEVDISHIIGGIFYYEHLISIGVSSKE